MENKIPASMEKLLLDVKQKLNDEKLYQMFVNCYTNTLNTTVKRMDDGTTYVLTGDIPAMWLRDSVCQLRPYFVLAKDDVDIEKMLVGLVKRQFQYILMDPYANAFNEEANGSGHQTDDTKMSPWIWERKYEIDSLCFPLQMSYLLWKNTGCTAHFDEPFIRAVDTILGLWKVEQDHVQNSPYTFMRSDCYFTDTLPRDGKGAHVKPTGMTWSGFRPSDDACVYGYLIPSNMFAVVVLGYISEIATEVTRNTELAKTAQELAKEIKSGIEEYGTLTHEKYGKIYAYEVDGYGGYNIMDDANLPSLLAMPYIGYTDESDPVYINARKLILSEVNPYFYKGTHAQGIGSPHTP